MTGTVAEIHQGAPGQNGPVIVSLIRTDDHTWSIPIDTTLTDAYWAGQLYVTMATAAHKDGEIRAQLRSQFGLHARNGVLTPIRK
jgi:hypothetical protein